MKTHLARIVLVSAALVLPLAALSRAPYTPPGADSAILRMSWRMSIEARENCRPRSAEELERLPIHMRTPEVCSPDAATYALVTRIGEGEPDTLTLVRGGVKEDRPLFVLEDRRLEPGTHRVRVGVHRLTETSGDSVLASLDSVLTLRVGSVQLVTLGPDGRTLVVRSPEGG